MDNGKWKMLGECSFSIINYQLSIKKKMDRANYKNGTGRYPLSTEGLDFIQRQIELIYSVAELHGRNYILKDSTVTSNGIIVVAGEMMPLEGSPLDYIQVLEEYDKLEADGMVFEKARVRRVAKYSSHATGEGCYAASLFKKLTTIEEMTPHLMPKGAIVMWSGAIDAIPAGWALCDGENGTPNLCGRFIVGVGKSSDGDTDYKLNKTGGDEEITLRAAQSGLPNHKHNYSYVYRTDTNDGNTFLSMTKSSGGEYLRIKTLTTPEFTGKDATAPHENRPPFYVLAYIMKVK